MFRDRIRALRARLPRTRRADLTVAAYCHAFDATPPAVETDGGERRDDDR